MPLAIIDASAAIAHRKSNPHATWGDRAEQNRVEPVALPAFDTPFRIPAGETIFTVGSCFARNVETELLRRGFRIPVREMFEHNEFRNVDLATKMRMINNYGTPSIYNEFAWAFDEQAYEPCHNILEVRAGKYADLHITPTIRPEDRDVVLGRRKALRDLYASVRHCRTIIMTLGLAEVWFDRLSGLYLNGVPRLRFVETWPARFELHVLNYDEVYGYLWKAIELIRRHGQPDLRILLTVSPVPLMTTFRAGDVLLANCYSKSVIRAAAEAIACEFACVTYYPSYESVTLSDRKVAFAEDLTHPTERIVEIQVSRMIAAFVDNADPDNAVEALVSLARQECEAPEAASSPAADAAAARDFLLQNNIAEASRLIERLRDSRTRSPEIWMPLLETAIVGGHRAVAQGIAKRIRKQVRQMPPEQPLMLAQTATCHGMHRVAAYILAPLFDQTPLFEAGAALACSLIHLGRNEDAREIVDALVPTDRAQHAHLDRLRESIPQPPIAQ